MLPNILRVRGITVFQDQYFLIISLTQWLRRSCFLKESQSKHMKERKVTTLANHFICMNAFVIIVSVPYCESLILRDKRVLSVSSTRYRQILTPRCYQFKQGYLVGHLIIYISSHLLSTTPASPSTSLTSLLGPQHTKLEKNRDRSSE